MPVVFRGDTNWQRVAEPEWTREGWEYDQCAVLFRGPRTKKDTFENAIPRFETMPGFPGMRLKNAQSQNVTPSFPGVVKNYVGFRAGIPPAKGVSSIAAAVARVTGTDTASGKAISANVAYRAARTAWTWYEISTPAADNPRYRTVINATDPRTRIDYIAIEDEDGKTTVPYSAFVAIWNALAVEYAVTDYQTEPIVPGAIWHCSACVDYRIRST